MAPLKFLRLDYDLNYGKLGIKNKLDEHFNFAGKLQIVPKGKKPSLFEESTMVTFHDIPILSSVFAIECWLYRSKTSFLWNKIVGVVAHLLHNCVFHYDIPSLVGLSSPINSNFISDHQL